MRVRAILKNMPGYKQEYLEADLNHLKAYMKYEIAEEIDKFRNNRGLTARVVNMLKKVSPLSNITIDMFLDRLEIAKQIELMKVEEIKHEGKTSTFTLYVDDLYFQMVDLLGKNNFKFLVKGNTKKKFVEKLKKMIYKDYTKDFEVIVEG